VSTYAQLKTDIAEWLARGDLTAVIPTFVRLCETDINNDFRLLDMIRRARAAGADSRYLPIPDGLLEFRRMSYWPDADRVFSLIQVSPENLQVLDTVNTSTGSYQFPQRYTVHREIEFDAPASSDADIEMIYYVRYPALASDTDTNWILQNAYGAYLYGSLLHAKPYLRDEQSAAFVAAGYENAVQSTMKTEKRSRTNQAATRVSVSGATP